MEIPLRRGTQRGSIERKLSSGSTLRPPPRPDRFSLCPFVRAAAGASASTHSKRAQPHRPRDTLLMGLCWASFAAFVMFSESLRAFVSELNRLLAKL